MPMPVSSKDHRGRSALRQHARVGDTRVERFRSCRPWGGTLRRSAQRARISEVRCAEWRGRLGSASRSKRRARTSR